MGTCVAQNYYSTDFEWDELKQEVERNPCFQWHLLPFKCSSLEDAQQATPVEAWNKFYARHSSGKFFKERRYLLKEFPELGSCKEGSRVLEVGCGNGSTALAILGGQSSSVVYACDCSNEAISKAKEIVIAADSICNPDRFFPFQCDFSKNGFPSWLIYNDKVSQKHHLESFTEKERPEASSPEETSCYIGGVDFVTLIFTLSAIPYERMQVVIRHCFSVLKPGGLLFFRDYGLYDMTMLRFKPDQRVSYREYMRSDGTRSYFFCLDTTRALTSSAGFNELEYCCVNSVNRRNGKNMKRVWVHGKFQKPAV